MHRTSAQMLLMLFFTQIYSHAYTQDSKHVKFLLKDVMYVPTTTEMYLTLLVENKTKDTIGIIKPNKYFFKEYDYYSPPIIGLKTAPYAYKLSKEGKCNDAVSVELMAAEKRDSTVYAALADYFVKSVPPGQTACINDRFSIENLDLFFCKEKGETYFLSIEYNVVVDRNVEIKDYMKDGMLRSLKTWSDQIKNTLNKISDISATSNKVKMKIYENVPSSCR